MMYHGDDMRCGTCIYYADRVGICCNPEGEMNTQPMAYDDGCKDWRPREWET